jgi:hypothetical protein
MSTPHAQFIDDDGDDEEYQYDPLQQRRAQFRFNVKKDIVLLERAKEFKVWEKSRSLHQRG